MNIAVNTRLLLPDKFEGLGRFACETLQRITKQHPEHRFIFIFDRKYSEEFIFSDNIVPVVAHPQSRHPLLWYLFFDWGVPQVLRKYKADLFFSPDGWLSLRTDVPSLPVIHDLNFFHNPEWVEWMPRLYYNNFFPRFISKANRIATVSEFSKQDILSRYPVPADQIDVVYNGVSVGFEPLSADMKTHIKKFYAGGHNFFLFVGLVHPRKNMARVIKAFDAFKEVVSSPVKLLILGSTRYMTSDVQQAFDNSKFKKDILFTGRVTDIALKQITASAMALVYTSLFEGFGIPILEAMSCDVPVITSDTTSMPEVGGDAVLYTDPYSVDSIALAMRTLYCDPEVSRKLIEKGRIRRQQFSWDKTAGLMWNSIEKLLIQTQKK
jgi:glycosyltransferase involved in cell wall biosynthesis